jgi:DNA-directed RNA polymerase subunit RPC12/RpoP
MLAPPPPKVKEKPTDVAVVCQLCGTRIHVKIAKIGQEVKCPDCHSRNLVVGPKEEGAAKSKGPTLEGTENFGMSEVVQRPKYRPMQASRGEYEVLSALDPAAIEHRMTVPDSKSHKKKLVAAPAADQSAEADEPHGELTLEAPIERAEAARDPRTVLPQPELEDEDPMYDGRYDDGVLGDGVDPRARDAWKKAPLVYGIVEFLFRPGTILRWVMFAALLTIIAELAKLGVYYAQQEGNIQVVVLFIMWAGIPTLGVWLFSFAAAFHAIVEATGNGEDDVANWPDWNVFGWFGPAFFVLIAAVAAAVPGGLIGAATFAASVNDPRMAAFGIGLPPVLSMLVLFPIFYCSMLIEDNLLALISGYTLRSFKIAGDAWIFSYMYAILLALLGTGAVATAAADNFVFTAVGAAATVAVLIIYARLLGRLMWVAAQRDAKYGG